MYVPSDLVIITWPIRAPAAKQVFLGLLGARSHQASVECTLVMKHQGHVRQIRLSFHNGLLTTITMFLIAESVMLGSREKLSKVFLLEPVALVLSSFEIVFVKMYVIIYVKKPYHVNSKRREKMLNKKRKSSRKNFNGNPRLVQDRSYIL